MSSFCLSQHLKSEEAKTVQNVLDLVKREDIYDSEIVIETKEYTLTKQSFLRLQPNTWLNDECVNAYVALIN